MNTDDFFTVMLKIVLILAVVVFGYIIYDAMSHLPVDYTTSSTEEFNKLKSPVIMIGKDEFAGMWDITVKDADNKVLHIGNMSGFANSIGASRMVGDTLK
jgi:hypothetical protein